MRIVIIGGTGLIGSKLAKTLTEHGHEVLAAAPSTGVDTITGEGLGDALDRAAVVVDVSNSPSFEDEAVLRFFETSTRNLLAAEAAAGVRHHVALSVVGTERLFESGYFRAKVAQERLIEQSSIPWSMVRSTQFFEFVHSIADAAAVDDTVRLAPALVQPIAADDVASVLGGVAAGMPRYGVLEVAGPEQLRLNEFIRHGLRRDDDPRQVVADQHARYFGAELHERTLLPSDAAIVAETSFDDWARNARPVGYDRASQVERAHEGRPAVVDELIYEHARVSGESFQLDPSTWAIHGFIPVDGDVILAKFDNRYEAQAAITQFRELERP